MDLAGGLERVEQEIARVENEKLQQEQMLTAFWEHLPPIDPLIIRDRMVLIKNQIDALENRKRALLQEQQELIAQAVICGRQGD